MLPAWMRVYGMGEPDHGQYDRVPLDFVYGCAMIIRRAVVEQAGLFDERFFMYYEDVDFCIRATQAGYRSALLPEITVWHDGSKSTSESYYLREFYHARSRMIFFLKHLRGFRIAQFFARETLYVFGTLRRNLFRRDLKAIGWYLRGIIQGIALGSVQATGK
jgi:GT2 family glycosyltransferase